MAATLGITLCYGSQSGSLDLGKLSWHGTTTGLNGLGPNSLQDDSGDDEFLLLQPLSPYDTLMSRNLFTSTTTAEHSPSVSWSNPTGSY